MLPESLDLPTLLIAAASVIAFSGLTLIVARGRDSDSVSLVIWGTAMLVGAIGLLLFAVPAGSFGPVAGTLLPELAIATMLFGTALAWAAARTFAGRRAVPLLIALGPAAWLLLANLPFGPGPTVAAVAASLVGSFYTLASAIELWPEDDERLRSRPLAIGLILVHAVVYLGRAALVGAWGQGGTGSLTAILLFEAMLHTVGIAQLLLAMAKERAALQSVLQLQRLVLLDDLTGLGNRRLFDKALNGEFNRACRDGAPLALLMIDIDHFKLFNDTYGHQFGDECLRIIATAIRAAVHRPADVVARYGGEEFAVLLAMTEAAGARQVADAIHANLAAVDVPHGRSGPGRVTVSIGIGAIPSVDPTHSPDSLVRIADNALYAAKAAGRNRTIGTEPDVAEVLMVG